MPRTPGHDDPIQFTPDEHDVRLERGDWIYYVRGVKKGEMLLGGAPTGLEGIVVALTVGLFWAARQERNDQWKVGVVRFRRDRSGRIRLVHKETLGPGEGPEARISELVGDVTSGRFDDA